MPDPKRLDDKRLPRDAAGSLDLEGGTGGIIAMCSCDEFLEVYKEDMTFHVKGPESVDPGRTNPNAPFVAAVADKIGSSSPVVARVLLQGQDIIQVAIFDRPIDKAAVTRVLHAAKESLFTCQKVAERVMSYVDHIVEDIRSHGVARDSRGRALNPFPQVPDLETEATTFLIHAKRAVQTICRLPSLFLPVEPKDTNFDALLKTLSKVVDVPAAVTEFVRDNADGVRYLIELRNFQEHPDAKRTVVDNFKVMPDGTISVPMWYLSDDTPRPVREEMSAAVEFLIQMAEAMLIHLVMATVTNTFPFIIEQIEDAQVNPKMPIKYRLSVDIARMKVDPQASN